jgi:hypothetical protein
VNGFVIVRNPRDCRKYSEFPLFVQNGLKAYHGVDRCAWDEFTGDDERFHLNLYRETELGPCGINVISDRELIDCLIVEGVHEVVWVSSGPDATRQANLLGIDLMTDRGSAIAQGIFKNPELFVDFIPALNQFGLFSSINEELNRYCARYLHLQDSARELEKFRSLGTDNAVYVYADS